VPRHHHRSSRLLRPAEDVALYRAAMAVWPGRGELRAWQREIRDWVLANDRCRRDILERLREDGPLAARDIPDSCEVPWRSTGWTNNKNVPRLLGFMASRGEVAVAGRDARDWLWDLAERVFPDDRVAPFDEAERERDRRRLRSLGIARPKAAEQPVEPISVGTTGEAAEVEGVRGTWRVDPELLDESFEGRAALLSPLDRLVCDRARTAELFEFEYQLEMYKPAAKRRWGYYALPVLYGDRLVGKLDSAADHRAGVFRVHALHQDMPFTSDMTAAVDAEIQDLADWLRLDLVRD
jgi:uncharacterized protein YcaQ